MARAPHSGPAELVLAALVARRYYLDDRSKIEIADEFSVSRFKVARLLASARSTGLVRIEIRSPGAVDVELSGELRTRLGLEHAIVIATEEADETALRHLVGRAGADLLAEIVTADDVLGLAWARSLLSMRAGLTHLAPCTVVQLTGALSRSDVDDSSIELVREVARIANGPAFFFYAPMIVKDAATARALRQQAEVARAIESFSSVTKAVVGVGSWDPPHSTIYDAISPKERDLLRRRGVCTDISGVLVDCEGKPVASALTDRIIGMTAEQMMAIPETIALVYGEGKAHAAMAAIRGRLVNGLVTHASFARELLALA
jgi:DNA-binding transcriptional regulator LsrR (DeoR family)